MSVPRAGGWYRPVLRPEEIAAEIGHINLAQMHAALAFGHANRAEIDAALAQEERLAMGQANPVTAVGQT